MRFEKQNDFLFLGGYKYNGETLRIMKKIALLIAFSMFCVAGFAQIQDPEQNSGSYGYDTPDTTQQYDEYGNPINPEPEGEEEEVIAAKPYERIVLNIDSVTNLITYVEVVEQEESNSDSLYIRAKRWAQVRFAKSEKGLFEIDKKNQKLVINGVLTAYRYNSKYTKRDVGHYYFKMTVWIKEGRYKYQITNLVHEGVKPNRGNPVRNYFEFYYTSPKNVKPYDMLLRDADTDIKKLMADFTKSMKDPIIVDEEDW
jgi:hypothetical protein